MKKMLLYLILVAGTINTAASKEQLSAQRAKELVNNGKILPLNKVIKINAQVLTGKILDVELEYENNVLSYEIKIVNKQGERKELYFDATSGKLIKIETEE